MHQTALYSKEFYLQNIEIAQKYLAHFHMMMNPDSVCMDCCYFPSFGERAFYMQVQFENAHFTGHCVYTDYADYLGIQSRSVNFLEIEQANQHPAMRGDVFCKIIPLNTALIEQLTAETKCYKPKTRNGITIDGVYANIRLFEHGAETANIRAAHDDAVISLLSAIAKQL